MAQAQLPPERLAELRQLIQTRISGEDMREQIRCCVAATICAGGKEEREGERASEREVLRLLEERGLVEQVMRSLNLGGAGAEGGVTRADSCEEASVPPALQNGLPSHKTTTLFPTPLEDSCFPQHDGKSLRAFPYYSFPTTHPLFITISLFPSLSLSSPHPSFSFLPTFPPSLPPSLH